jgi:3',5'-cyclic-AMP phosphodiesterase
MINKNRIILIAALFMSAVSSYAQQKFSFVFMSDIHYTQKFDAPRGFQMAVDTINKIHPDFIMVGGDMVYDALRSSQKDAVMYANAYIKAAANIKAPIYYAMGNHEVFQLYNKTADTNNVIYGKAFYEKYFGKRYYSFNHKGWHFMVLDNIFINPDRKYIGKIDSVQMAWIVEDLKTVDPKTPIVIMAHVPLITTLSQWYGGGTNANDDKIAAVDSHKIIKLFANKNLRLILQGHLHYFEALNILNKVIVITAPSVSGEWWRGKQHNVEEGVIKINIDGDHVQYDYIDYKWEAVKEK